MIRRILALFAFLMLGACAAVEPAPERPATPPEVNIVSDYPPVKAAVVPAMRELGYQVVQDTQFWTIFSRPATGDRPETRLTVTFASIRTHTRVIADTQYLTQTAQGPQYVPAPRHPDWPAIQARLDQVRRDIERRPVSERRAPAPPPGAAPPMPGAPRVGVQPATPPVPGTPPPPAAAPAPAEQPPLQPGQTRIRL